jgi:hypothetical protein
MLVGYPGLLLEDPRRKNLIEKIAAGFVSLVPEGSDTTIESLRDCYGCLLLANFQKLEYLITQYLLYNPHQDGRKLLGRVQKNALGLAPASNESSGETTDHEDGNGNVEPPGRAKCRRGAGQHNR